MSAYDLINMNNEAFASSSPEVSLMSQLNSQLFNNISSQVSVELNAKEKKYIDCLKSSIDYFLSCKEPEKILFDNHECSYDHLNEILNITKYAVRKHKHSLNSNILNQLGDHALVSIFVKLIEYGFFYVKKAVSSSTNLQSPSTSNSSPANFDARSVSVFQIDSSTSSPFSSTSSAESSSKENDIAVFYFLNSLIQLIWSLTNFSKLFRQTFHQENGSKILLTYLDDRNFISDYILFEKHMNNNLDESLNDLSLVKALIGSLHNLSKSVNFQDLNGTFILLNFAHRMKSNSEYIMFIYMTLANILTDKEIEELPDTLIIIQKLLQTITTGACLISSEKEGLKRVKIELENGNLEYVCMLTDDNHVQWDITELLSGLYRIAVNDKIKYYIYNDCNINEQMNKIITYGNSVEKEFAIKLLYQLSFDPNVAMLMHEDKAMISTINRFIHNESYFGVDSSLIKLSKGLIWMIDNKIKSDHQTNDKSSAIPNNTANRSKHHLNGSSEALSSQVKHSTHSSNESQSKSNGKQIMISYNSFSREICLKIKKVLENMGYKIWIDIESMYGCSLEAMASAIEKSDLILICMSQKYKLSPNCRAEAEYAFNIRKKYIPLIMEKNYKPDGWLGLILGAKIFIDFAKYSFDDATEKLKHELRQHLNEIERKPPLANSSMRSFEKQTANCLHSSSSASDLVKQSTSSNSSSSAITTMMANKTTTNKISEKSQYEEHLRSSSQHSLSVVEWTKQDVKDWLSRIEISEKLSQSMANFDGETLNELNAIRLYAPNYFYECLGKEHSLSLVEIVRFSKEMRKLFN